MDIVTLALAKNYTKEAVGGLWDRWDSTVSYAKGQIVLYNGIPYQAKQTTTAGTWVASEWQQINISDALEKIDDKVDKPTIVTETAPTSITLVDNTEYTLTDVADLTFTYPTSGSYSVWIRLTTSASGTVSISFPASSYIGSQPTFGNGETWEISIKDGVIVAGKAVVGT